MSTRTLPALDDIDEQLLAILQENARTPTAVLARRLGLSRTTVQSRISRLERTGVIAGYSVRINEAARAGRVHAYVMIAVAPRYAARVANEVRKLDAVRTLEAVSGNFDLLAIVTAPSVAQLDAIIDAIGAMEGIERTQSSLALSTKFDRR